MNAGPSSWSRRALIVTLALVGFVVSLYLACFQAGIVTAVWDPIFGSSSSEAVLKSSFSRALPVPDALLGACAYLVEIVLDSIGGERRYRTRSWLVLLFGLVAVGAAGVSVLLVVLQVFVFQAFCTLCLISAIVSWLILLLAFAEIRAAAQEVRARHRSGASWRASLLSRPQVR